MWNVFKAYFKNIVLFIMIFVIAISLSSCRTSPALLKIIYTDNASVDKNVQEKDNNISNEELDDLLSARKENEDVSKQDFLNTKYTSKKKTDNTDKKGAADGSSGNQSGTNIQGNDKSNSVSATNPVAVKEQVDVQETETRNLREIDDALIGKNVKIPENVNTVSACGDVAPYVAILGGTQYITVTSESFKNNAIAAEVFGSSEMGRMKDLFSGTGSTYISDSNFKQLIAIKPDVCFVISGQAVFTDAQLNALSKKLIYVVTLPKLNTTDNIKKAVNIIATVLGDSGGQSGKKDASHMAASYISWMDNMISNVKSKHRQFSGYTYTDFNNDVYENGGKTNPHQTDDGFFTLLVSSWDSVASYCVGSISGTGMGICTSGYSNSPVSYAISIGGAANKAALSGYIPKNYYVSPLGLDTVATLKVRTNLALWSAERSHSMIEYTSLTGGSNGMKYSIGSPKFSTIIAGTKDVKNHILSDSLWKLYPMISDGTGEYNGVSMSGVMVRSYVTGSYTVAVTPGGIGSWITGSPEAFLEAVFINSIFYGDYSMADLSNEISSFYSAFYGKTPSSSTLTRIISGYDI